MASLSGFWHSLTPLLSPWVCHIEALRGLFLTWSVSGLGYLMPYSIAFKNQDDFDAAMPALQHSLKNASVLVVAFKLRLSEHSFSLKPAVNQYRLH